MERKSILKSYIKFENVVEVQRQWKRVFQTQPPTRLTIHGFVTSLIHMVPFVMCMGEDPEELVQIQVLLLQLWFWKGLQRRHGSLLVLCSILTCIQLVMYN